MKKILGFAAGHRALVAGGSMVAAFVGATAPSYATATYDITPVTTSLTSDLTANVPIILAAVGGLIALTLAIRMVRKFVKA